MPSPDGLLYRTRLGPKGAYFASPVAGDGKIFAASHNGAIVVFAAGETFQRLAVNELHEPIFATPAIADGRLYVRTESSPVCVSRHSSVLIFRFRK